MSTGALIGILVAIIVVGAAAVVVALELRRARLRRQFGPEYTRLAKELGSERKAQTELLARQRRAAKLNISPLSAAQQARYTRDWTGLQERFVDAPADAVTGAANLVARLLKERGYPADDQNELVVALSVHHPRQLDQYRKGMSISGRSGSVSTEELREAMLSYRALFNDLAGAKSPQAPASQPTGPRTILNRVTSRVPQGR
jgi:hypothetical protein